MRRIVLALLCFVLFSQVEAQTTKVLIKTNMGNMKAVLWDDTPKHRDEFVRLVKAKHFDGTLFCGTVDVSMSTNMYKWLI